jgi:hypothetical protein
MIWSAPIDRTRSTCEYFVTQSKPGHIGADRFDPTCHGTPQDLVLGFAHPGHHPHDAGRLAS